MAPHQAHTIISDPKTWDSLNNSFLPMSNYRITIGPIPGIDFNATYAIGEILNVAIGGHGTNQLVAF
jgi:hypothetical protein